MERWLQEAREAIEAELWTFAWSIGDGSNLGEISVDNDEPHRLRLDVYVRDNENPDSDQVHPLTAKVDIQPLTAESPREQIRELIHQYLCHEADEQMWWGSERPFHPHEDVA